MTDAANNSPTSASPFTPELIASVFNDGTPPEPEQAAEPEAVPAEAQQDEAAAVTPSEAPKEKSAAERIAAALKAEKKAAQLRAENAEREKKIAEREAKLGEREPDIELFKSDPAAFIAKQKWTSAQVAEFLEKLAGQVAPENVSEKKLTTVEQELAQLKAELKAKEDAERTRELTAAQQAAQREAGQAFVKLIADNAERFPHLTSEYSEEQAVAEGFAVLSQVIGRDAEGRPVTRGRAFEAQHGRSPTDEELAEYLDSLAKAKIEAKTKASWRKGAATSQASQATGDAKVPPVKGTTSPRTLSRADTSERATAPRVQGWSQEVADQKSIEILARSMKR